MLTYIFMGDKDLLCKNLVMPFELQGYMFRNSCLSFMLMMLSLHNDKIIIHIGKIDLKGTYIHFPDVQT